MTFDEICLMSFLFVSNPDLVKPKTYVSDTDAGSSSLRSVVRTVCEWSAGVALLEQVCVSRGRF